MVQYAKMWDNSSRSLLSGKEDEKDQQRQYQLTDELNQLIPLYKSTLKAHTFCPEALVDKIFKRIVELVKKAWWMIVFTLDLKTKRKMYGNNSTSIVRYLGAVYYELLTGFTPSIDPLYHAYTYWELI